MTSKDYHNLMREKSIQKNGFVCLNCGKTAEGLAHGIPQRKPELAEYGWRVVHHWSNLYPACNSCNAGFQKKQYEYLEYASEIMEKIIEEDGEKIHG